MPPKKQKTSNLLEMVATGERYGALIDLVKKYSRTMNRSEWFFSKKGLRIMSVDKTSASMICAAVGKDFFESYAVDKEFVIIMDDQELEKLKGTCRDAGIQELSIRIGDPISNFKMKYGNINKTMKVPVDESEPKIKIETVKKVYKGSKPIGETNIEEMKLFIQASATWKGESNRVSKITKNKSRFEITTEIVPKHDYVILDLNKALENKTKEKTLNMLFVSESINNGIKQMMKLTDRIALRGNTDYPLIIMAKDQDPADLDDFSEKINWWFMIAPLIESE